MRSLVDLALAVLQQVVAVALQAIAELVEAVEGARVFLQRVALEAIHRARERPALGDQCLFLGGDHRLWAHQPRGRKLMRAAFDELPHGQRQPLAAHVDPLLAFLDQAARIAKPAREAGQFHRLLAQAARVMPPTRRLA